MRIAICDDLKIYRNQIKNLIKTNREFIEIEEFSSAEKLLEKDLMQYDIFFLDIEMGDMTGIKLAAEIKKVNKNTVVIFVTSHAHYVSEAMKNQPFQFLLKPIDEKLFLEELDRAMNEICTNKMCISISRYGIKRIVDIRSISYIERIYRVVCVATVENEQIESSQNFDDLADQLESYHIIRCHNSFLINLDEIKKLNRIELITKNDIKIPVSKKYSNEVKEKHRQFISGVCI